MAQPIAQADHVGQLAAARGGPRRSAGPDRAAAPRCSPAPCIAGSGCTTERRSRSARRGCPTSWSSFIWATSSSPRKNSPDGRLIEAAEQVEQRALAGAGRAHDGDVVARGHVEGDAAQGADRLALEDVVLLDIDRAAPRASFAPSRHGTAAAGRRRRTAASDPLRSRIRCHRGRGGRRQLGAVQKPSAFLSASATPLLGGGRPSRRLRPSRACRPCRRRSSRVAIDEHGRREVAAALAFALAFAARPPGPPPPALHRRRPLRRPRDQRGRRTGASPGLVRAMSPTCAGVRIGQVRQLEQRCRPRADSSPLRRPRPGRSSIVATLSFGRADVDFAGFVVARRSCTRVKKCPLCSARACTGTCRASLPPLDVNPHFGVHAAPQVRRRIR